MSIIRQRRKNLIISGLLGFMISALVLTALAYIYRQPLAEALDIAPEEKVALPVTVPAMVAAKPIQKGTILEADHVITIMVQEENRVAEHFADISELVGKKTAMDIDANMPFTMPMFVEDDLVSTELRLYEVSFIELPYHLSVGEIVDIRIAFPTGQEYVVLSKKEVRGYERQTDSVHNGLLSLALEETEALRLSSALVDCFIAEGTRVYMVKYVAPEQQEAAEVNYPVNENVLLMLKDNPNILEVPDLAGETMARETLKAALEAIIDENNEVAYRVDMTTPGMNLETMDDGAADRVQSVEEPEATGTAGQGVVTAPSADSDSSDIGAGAAGIGF